MKNPSFRQPSAFLPLAMSIVALAIILIHAAIFGVVHEADEGTTAHVFQLLMTAQLPIIAFFVFKWFPPAPLRALTVLALQAAAACAAITAVILLT